MSVLRLYGGSAQNLFVLILRLFTPLFTDIIILVFVYQIDCHGGGWWADTKVFCNEKIKICIQIDFAYVPEFKYEHFGVTVFFFFLSHYNANL